MQEGKLPLLSIKYEMPDQCIVYLSTNRSRGSKVLYINVGKLGKTLNQGKQYVLYMELWVGP
jgi:hypothetical protein